MIVMADFIFQRPRAKISPRVSTHASHRPPAEHEELAVGLNRPVCQTCLYNIFLTLAEECTEDAE